MTVCHGSSVRCHTTGPETAPFSVDDLRTCPLAHIQRCATCAEIVAAAYLETVALPVELLPFVGLDLLFRGRRAGSLGCRAMTRAMKRAAGRTSAYIGATVGGPAETVASPFVCKKVLAQHTQVRYICAMTTTTECTHGRQVRIADTDEWVCEDCCAQMDAENPDRRIA